MFCAIRRGGMFFGAQCGVGPGRFWQHARGCGGTLIGVALSLWCGGVLVVHCSTLRRGHAAAPRHYKLCDLKHMLCLCVLTCSACVCSRALLVCAHMLCLCVLVCSAHVQAEAWQRLLQQEAVAAESDTVSFIAQNTKQCPK